MGTGVLIKEYVQWHYDEGVWEIGEMWRNLMWFGYHYFSIPLLARTLFKPIYRIHEGYSRLQNMEEFFRNVISNMVARVAGLIMRLFMISIGLAFETIILILGPVLFVLWIILPAILGFLFLTGFYMIIA